MLNLNSVPHFFLKMTVCPCSALCATCVLCDVRCSLVEIYGRFGVTTSHQRRGSQWRTEGEFGGFNPPLEIPKALQNRAKINPIVKTLKNC